MLGSIYGVLLLSLLDFLKRGHQNVNLLDEVVKRAGIVDFRVPIAVALTPVFRDMSAPEWIGSLVRPRDLPDLTTETPDEIAFVLEAHVCINVAAMVG